MDKHAEVLAKEFGQKINHVENVINLLDEGNTVPFIARYRKEQHGTMDDQLIRSIADRLNYLRNLDKRKEEVLHSIEEQGKLTDELKAQIEAAETQAAIEDLYRPYKQKRRTRATVAKEKGLEPLADLLFNQELQEGSIDAIAAEYIDTEKGVESAEEALAGAGDIIAEKISDDADIRRLLKDLIYKAGLISSKGTTEDDSVYRQYYDYTEAVGKIPSHRVLAINRGEAEKFLKVSVEVDEPAALTIVKNHSVKKERSISSDFVSTCAEDAYSRLIFPSVEREIRNELTDMASEQAIHMFGLNLKPLLMQPPVKNKVTMGFDPAYRTGCKIAVVDETGKVLETGVVYPTPPHNKTEEAKKILAGMIRRNNVTAIAIGNGTASKESEIFVADMIADMPDVAYMMVNEAGASVYSASKLGAEEFPQYDVSLRSAVSIARRLQDPLAELVKIDPKAIGVGQYQHDMPQARLDETLSGVVEDCVNAVGVDLNTASPSLLARVSGLSSKTAKNIVSYRENNGIFRDRNSLINVSGIGPKAFEQCAGFLRVPESENVLDHTGVHPESYEATKKLLTLCGLDLESVSEGAADSLNARIKLVGEEKISDQCGIGIPTIRDIVRELAKPGRDPRDELPPTMLRTDVMKMEDLKPGMIMRGTVRNVVDFGCFVDIGVHQDGLVHISEISDKYIKHPSEAVKVGDVLDTYVMGVDPEKKRISLSIKKAKNG